MNDRKNIFRKCTGEHSKKSQKTEKQAGIIISGLLFVSVFSFLNNFVQGVFDNPFGAEIEKLGNNFTNVGFGHDRLD